TGIRDVHRIGWRTYRPDPGAAQSGQADAYCRSHWNELIPARGGLRLLVPAGQHPESARTPTADGDAGLRCCPAAHCRKAFPRVPGKLLHRPPGETMTQRINYMQQSPELFKKFLEFSNQLKSGAIE